MRILTKTHRIGDFGYLGRRQGHHRLIFTEFSAERWRGWGTQGALLPVVAPAQQYFDVPIGGPDAPRPFLE